MPACPEHVPVRPRRLARRLRRNRPCPCRHHRVRRPAVLTILVLLAHVAPALAGPALDRAAPFVAHAEAQVAGGERPMAYRFPVDAPVVRGFEPPDGPYGAGHRGIDLDASPGTAVRAAEEGLVRHAGAVAGVTWVSVDHPDGLRTSYGPLTGLTVAAGDPVGRGDLLGVVAATHHGAPERDRGLHLGVRRGDVYLDPLTLPGLTPPRPTLVGPGGWWGSGHAVTPYDPWQGGRLHGVLTAPSPTATEAGFAVPPNPNHLVLVSGLASGSSRAIVDPSHLGIAPASATHLSYAGRHDLTPTDLAAPGAAAWRDDLLRDQLPYGPAHTWAGVEHASALLEAQLRAQAAREPGRAVDLVGHSMGGVVIAHYLLTRHDPYDRTLPPIAHVVTIASPLEGADTARAGLALIDNPLLGTPVRLAWDRAAQLPGVIGHSVSAIDPSARAVVELASGSDLLAQLGRAWTDALERGTAGPFATGTRMLSVVGSLDAVVTADRAALPGGERRVLPGTHDGVLTSEAVREVTWRFLAGREVVASPGHLATAVGTAYGSGLTFLSATLGDRGAVGDLVRR
jgi:murein DD-endopeptidase MepM/ murein hydrolase activator NlpD